MLNLTNTARKIKEGRNKAGLTQDQLAERLHVSKQAVSNWERGKNLPDEGTRDKIEKILCINLCEERMNNMIHNTINVPELMPLAGISSIDDIKSSVDAIVDSVIIREYEHPVKKMLYLTLFEILGYEIYYEVHCRKYYSDDPLDWMATASDLQSLFMDSDPWPLEKTTYHFQARSIFAKKVEWISYMIGGELFEDFDEEGYRNGFEQQIGRYGEQCGYELLNLLPDSPTDIMIIYKTALLDIVEILESIPADK